MTRRISSLFLLVCAALSAVPSARAQVGATSTAVPFLLISPTSRASAMGELGVATSEDISAAFFNPAGFAFQTGKEIGFNHSQWLPQFQQADLFFEFGGFKMDIPEIDGTVAASLTFLNLGEFEQRDEANNFIRKFSSFELAFATSYGARIDEDLGLGVGLRLIHSSLSQVQVGREQGSGTATTVSGDIGILYRPSKLLFPFTDWDMGNHLSLGTAITNMGPSVSYIDEAQSDPLPTNWRLGFGYDLVREKYNRLTWSVETSHLLVARDSVNGAADPFFEGVVNSFNGDWLKTFTFATGIEYWYSNLIALRAGYFYEDPSQGNRNFLTFGAGVRYDIYGFDFSYLSTAINSETVNSPLSETLRFTLSIIWDNTGVQDDGSRTPVDDSTK